jgi:hypothetical protein
VGKTRGVTMDSEGKNEIEKSEIPEYSFKLDKDVSKDNLKARKNKWALAFEVTPRPRKPWYDELKKVIEGNQLRSNWEKQKSESDRDYIIFYTDYAGNKDEMVDKLKKFKEECEEILLQANKMFREEKIKELKKEKQRQARVQEQKQIVSEVLQEIDE